MYHLFGFDRLLYDTPRGGIDDYLISFDKLEDAEKETKKYEYQYYHIIVQKDGDYINPASLVLVEESHNFGNSWIEHKKD